MHFHIALIVLVTLISCASGSTLQVLLSCLATSDKRYDICITASGEIAISEQGSNVSGDKQNDKVLLKCIETASAKLHVFYTSNVDAFDCETKYDTKAVGLPVVIPDASLAPSIIRDGLPSVAGAHNNMSRLRPRDVQLRTANTSEVIVKSRRSVMLGPDHHTYPLEGDRDSHTHLVSRSR